MALFLCMRDRNRNMHMVIHQKIARLLTRQLEQERERSEPLHTQKFRICMWMRNISGQL